MNCQQSRRYLSPYLDSELDAIASFEISTHLEVCSACRERFESEARIEIGIREHLVAGAADPAALGRLRNFVSSLEVSKGASQEHTRAARPRWVLPAAAVLVFGVVGVLATRFARDETPTDSIAFDLLVEAVNHHRRFGTGDLLVESGTASVAGANRVFSEKLTFECRVESSPFMVVDGALTCTFGQVPAALIHGRVDGESVSIFAVPAGRLAWFSEAEQRLAGRQSLAGVHDDLAYLFLRRDDLIVMVVARAHRSGLIDLAQSIRGRR